MNWKEDQILVNRNKDNISFFAQHGEDRYLFGFIKDSATPKLAVEIGAIDGVWLSNIRFFLTKLGWEGLFVEPGVESYREIIENYKDNPRVKAIWGACSRYASEEIGFNNNENPGLSKIDMDCDTIVPNYSYQSILELSGLANRAIGILSIDTEGMDTPILEMALNHKYLPEFIIIEASSSVEAEKQASLLNNKYELINTLNVNTIWRLKNGSKAGN